MTADVKMIIDALSLLMTACKDIDRQDGCKDCPLRYECLRWQPVEDVADNVTVRQFENFLSYSDRFIGEEEDHDASYADMMRKWEREEADIDEEYGY